MVWNIRLRTLVGSIGLIVTLATFVAVPCGYFLVQYSNLSNELTFKSEVVAARVAKYVYLHQTLWQYQAPRIAEQIELTEADGENYALSVHDTSGAVVASAGPTLPAPLLVRIHPLVVSGAEIGHVEAVSSLRPLLWETGFAVLLSALFGIGIYFAVRVFPLAVLDRTVGALEIANTTIHERNEQLQVQNERFDAALSNMAQGLCMFDADRRLVIANGRFAEIFKIAPDAIQPGMPLSRVMEMARASVKNPEAAVEAQRRFLTEDASGTVVASLTDDRIISISHRPMRAGGVVTTFDDITEQRRAEEKIAHMARHDALTDLPNRVLFYERMEECFRRVRDGETLALLSLDLDRFKNVNDTLGHPIGDQLLQVAAERMRGCVRDDDIVARLGGDEFVIVQIPTTQATDASTLAARLIDRVGAPYDLDGHQVMIGASVGITLSPADGIESSLLVKNADLALYRAKSDGGGTYRFFEPTMDALMQARRALELDLRKALVKGEFELYYQPLMTLKTGRITTLEALVRWHHPERGMVAPSEFIPLAEETGLIVPLGEWVLREACTEAAKWPQDIMVSVNLSPVQFKSRNLVDMVASAIAASGLPAHRLELEITEMVLLQDNAATLAMLHQLRDLGIRIAMDDFGTGYSSLSYLRSFPFDKIKIDQSFIHDLPGAEDSLAIVRAVVGLGTSLGIATTAEGVETTEQLESLRREGCTEVQGFLFAAPRPAEEVRGMLAGLAAKEAEVA